MAFNSTYLLGGVEAVKRLLFTVGSCCNSTAVQC